MIGHVEDEESVGGELRVAIAGETFDEYISAILSPLGHWRYYTSLLFTFDEPRGKMLIPYLRSCVRLSQCPKEDTFICIPVSSSLLSKQSVLGLRFRFAS